MTPALQALYAALADAQGDVDTRLSPDTRAAVRGALVALSRELRLPCPIETRRERRARLIRPTR